MTDAATRFERICAQMLRANNRVWVETQRDAARARIVKGGGQMLVQQSGGLNGKNFTAAIRLDALDVADIAQSALDEADGLGSSGATGITTPDFS